MYIYIVRHGETSANVEGVLQGWTENPLNENGMILARITGKELKKIRFDECISSPLLRARQTAQIILEESGNSFIPIQIDNRIKEVNMGKWERKKYRSDECEVDSKQIKLFFTDTFHFKGFPDGETVQQVCERTQNFLKELILKNDRKNYLVITHGFALRAMLNFLYKNQQDFWHGHVPYNCAVNIIEVKNGKSTLVAEDIILYDSNKAVDFYAKF